MVTFLFFWIPEGIWHADREGFSSVSYLREMCVIFMILAWLKKIFSASEAYNYKLFYLLLAK